MKIAVITLAGSRYGKQLLHRLAESGRTADLAVVVTATRQRNWRLLRGVARRIGWFDALRYAAHELAQPAVPAGADRSYADLARAVVTVASVRGPEVPEIVRDQEIDLVLLGQSGIVPVALLEAPRMGTLNAHPGLLPGYRGVDCAEWAIMHDDFDQVGSSLHWVDAGVDTGTIVRRHPYVWRGDENLALLTARLYDDCVAMLVEASVTLRSEAMPELANAGGRQFYKMPWAQRRAVAAKLATFLARTPQMDRS